MSDTPTPTTPPIIVAGIDLSKLTVQELSDLKRALAGYRIPCPPVPGQPLKQTRTYHGRSFWEGLDWSKSNQDLAAEHGLQSQSCSIWRKKLGQASVSKWWPACQTWDWTLPNVELAGRHGCGVMTVQGLRARCGQPNVQQSKEDNLWMVDRKPLDAADNPDSQKRKLEFYATLDWTKPDIRLAEQVGVTREYIRQMRAQLGKPKMHARRHRFNEFKAQMAGVTEICFSDAVAKGINCSHRGFLQYCRKLGIKVLSSPWGAIKKSDRRTKHPWDQMNWKLPNNLLNDIWQIGEHQYQISGWRCNHTKGKAAFYWGVNRKDIPTDFQLAVAEERAKAEAWRASQVKPEVHQPEAQPCVTS